MEAKGVYWIPFSELHSRQAGQVGTLKGIATPVWWSYGANRFFDENA